MRWSGFIAGCGRKFLWAALIVPVAGVAQPVVNLSKPALIDFAMSHDGDVERGREIFNSERKTACIKCHTTDGSSGRVGSDLFSIGDKFSRRDLIRAVLEPSAEIAIGFGSTTVEDVSGETYLGIVKEVTADSIELMTGDGKRVRLAAKDIQSQRDSKVSLMPSGLEAGLTADEFANLIAYLGSLQPPASGPSRRGMPERIAPAAKAATFEPFFRDNLHFDHPVWFSELPGETNRFVVLEQFGKIRLVERGAAEDEQKVFADLSGEVYVGGGSALLGMTFHPQFRANRKYYLIYQVRENGQLASVLVERQFTVDFKGDSGASRVLLKIPASTQDHTGGAIGFGPDGFLYLGMGDTGPQRDPQGHAQNLSLLQGKILRLDVDHAENDLPYAIPANNPFRGRTNARPEIWAYGLREPWRMSFDPLTHDLWVGDVGQDRIEEVDIVRGGENYGWNVFEGFDHFSEKYRRTGEQYLAPIFAYTHHTGVSVTGGHVYRGQRAPALQGWYVCADFETRRVWALTQTNRVLQNIVEIGRAPSRAVSFTEMSDGEMCLVGFDSGVVYRLGLDAVNPAPLETRIIAPTSEVSPIEWRFTLTPPTSGWNQAGFDDSAWTKAPGGFGSHDAPNAMVRTEWHTSDIWLRREFDFPTNPPTGKNKNYTFRLHHDEDVEVFLNGVEAVRLPRWTTGYIEVPLAAQAAEVLKPSKNLIAIHCHQITGGQYIDAGLIELVAPSGAVKN